MSVAGSTGDTATRSLGHRDVLAIALPIIFSNVTEPLIGVVDTGVLGALDAPHLVGGVALGATFFSLAYFMFSFLRMGTSGLTAQADGADDGTRVSAVFAQALIVALVAGLALIMLQAPLTAAALAMLSGTPAVEAAAETYISIRIWSAPLALTNFAILGWLIGIRRTGLAVALQLLINSTNITLSILLVQGLGLTIDGVAWGTVLAELISASVGVWVVWREMHRRGALPEARVVFEGTAVRRVFAVNRDIMLRTLALQAVFVFFVNEGARAGEIVLAANAVLHHFMNVTAHVLDGFAYAAETLSGHAIGARNRRHFARAVKLSSLWAVLLAGVLSLACWLAGPLIIDLLTTSPEVRATARAYLPWAAATPIVGVACFQLDGIFIGATQTRDMRNATIASAVAFFAIWAVLTPMYANHGLWASVLAFFVARAISLQLLYPRLLKTHFATP
ncbi:MAG: MATE family efflux transporter [Pseudomonadota bacterium]